MDWSGSRTRDTRFPGPMLYPTELSNQLTCGTRTRNRWNRTPLLYRLSQRHRETPPCGYGHTRAAAPCAPDGIDAVPRVSVGGCFAWPPLAKRSSTCAVPAGTARNPCLRVRTRKKKPPVQGPRAFAFLGDRVTDLREARISRCGWCRFRRAACRRRKRRRAVRAKGAGGRAWRWRNRVSSDDCFTRNGFAGRRRARTIRLRFFRCKHFPS